jgi:surfeit locus 1 family protein
MFRLKLTLTLIALLSVLFFTRLGFWQLERAQQKQALRAAMQSRAELPPLVLHDLLSNHEELRFRRVLARGTFDPEQQILLDNRTY